MTRRSEDYEKFKFVRIASNLKYIILKPSESSHKNFILIRPGLLGEAVLEISMFLSTDGLVRYLNIANQLVRYKVSYFSL